MGVNSGIRWFFPGKFLIDPGWASLKDFWLGIFIGPWLGGFEGFLVGKCDGEALGQSDGGLVGWSEKGY